jgi:hypothetical protein
MSSPCEGLLHMIMNVFTCMAHDYRDIDTQLQIGYSDMLHVDVIEAIKCLSFIKYGNSSLLKVYVG